MEWSGIWLHYGGIYNYSGITVAFIMRYGWIMVGCGRIMMGSQWDNMVGLLWDLQILTDCDGI